MSGGQQADEGRAHRWTPIREHGQLPVAGPSAILSRTVARQRLLDLVSQGVRRPLTLVCAPAGFGKTMLLLSWETLGSWPGRVTHLAVDAADDQSAGSLQSALDGLHRRGAALAADRPMVLGVGCGDPEVTTELGDSLDRGI